MFTRMAIWIMLAMIFINGGVTALDAAGVVDTHGVEPSNGGDFSDQEAAADKAENPGGGDLGTLFGLRNFMGGLVSDMVNIAPAATLMKNVGVPEFLVDYLFVGSALIVGIGTVAFFRTGGGI